MLTLSQIMAVGRMDDQYGPPENSFSPRWHEQNPVSEITIPSITKDTGKKIKLVNAAAPLPEGYELVPNT